MRVYLGLLFEKLREYLTLANLLTLICTIPTGILSFDILADFLVHKPTSTSQKPIDFHPSYFPDLLICGHPSIDEGVAHEYGYEPAYYWQGRTGDWYNGRFIGWNGVNGTQNFTNIMDRLLSVKPDRGGLISQVWHLSKGVWIEETPEVEFRMLRYPHWRCQLLKPSKIKSLDKDTSFISLQVNHSLKDLKGDMEHPKSVLPKYIQKKGLQKGNMKKVKQGDKDSPMLDFLLVDPANSPLIFPQNLQMKGDRIRAPFDLGWRIFTIKVVRFKHLNNDPHFDCEEYNEDSSYGGCLKKELRKIYESALNCTPPLLVEEPSRNVSVCNKRFNMTEDKGNQIRDMFENNFNFKPALCKKPCTQTTYEVQSMQVIKYPTSSIGLNFDSSVDLTETEFRTTFVMLLTGLGGSVRTRAGKSKSLIQWKRQTCEKWQKERNWLCH